MKAECLETLNSSIYKQLWRRIEKKKSSTRVGTWALPCDWRHRRRRRLPWVAVPPISIRHEKWNSGQKQTKELGRWILEGCVVVSNVYKPMRKKNYGGFDRWWCSTQCFWAKYASSSSILVRLCKLVQIFFFFLLCQVLISIVKSVLTG